MTATQTIDRSDYDWQMDQLRPTVDAAGRCPVCGGAEFSDADGECNACGWLPVTTCACGSGLALDTDGNCVVCWMESR